MAICTVEFWDFGIPVVHYTNPILGSTRDLYENVGGLQDVQWMRKYGKIFGVYEGRQPIVYICVPELVRLISVKDADHFNGKREWEFGDPVMNEMPAFLPADKWKIVRSLATPAFSSAKLKMMSVPMRHATQDFITDIKEKIRLSGKDGSLEKFAIDQAIHTMLTDLISRALFSIQISCRSDKNNEFSKIVKDAMTPSGSFISPEIAMYSHAFPFLTKLFRQSIFKPEPVQKFVQIFKQLMNERRKQSPEVKHNDLIDMCLEWWDKLDSPEFKQAKITDLTLLAQVLVFFVAAQDQLSTMIAAVIFHMTKDPHLDKKIYEEVDRTFEKHDGKIEEEHLPQLVLLNSCISECLRLYGVFHRIERICTRDWKNEEYNLEFKKGTAIVIPIWALNRNEEYLDNPDEFDPERFLPEIKVKLNPYATTGFGFGPRNCTGKWFASLVMPLILANLFKELKFSGREDTQLKFVPGGLLMTPHEPIFVNVSERAKEENCQF